MQVFHHPIVPNCVLVRPPAYLDTFGVLVGDLAEWSDEYAAYQMSLSNYCRLRRQMVVDLDDTVSQMSAVMVEQTETPQLTDSWTQTDGCPLIFSTTVPAPAMEEEVDCRAVEEEEEGEEQEGVPSVVGSDVHTPHNGVPPLMIPHPGDNLEEETGMSDIPSLTSGYSHWPSIIRNRNTIRSAFSSL